MYLCVCVCVCVFLNAAGRIELNVAVYVWPITPHPSTLSCWLWTTASLWYVHAGLGNSLLVELLLLFHCCSEAYDFVVHSRLSISMCDDHLLFPGCVSTLYLYCGCSSRLVRSMAASLASFRMPVPWLSDTSGLREKWQKIERWSQKGTCTIHAIE